MTRLFVSDVHLDAAAPEAVEQFLEFLRTHAADAQALYILGDLFETWVGDDDPDPTAGGQAAFLLCRRAQRERAGAERVSQALRVGVPSSKVKGQNGPASTLNFDL